MFRTPITGAASALIVVALVASGCGGSKARSTASKAAPQPSQRSTSPVAQPSGQPLSRGELVARGDAICSKVNAKRESLKYRSINDYSTLLPVLAAYERTAADELGKLTAPQSMANDWQQIVTTSQLIAGDIARVAQFSDAHNLAAANRLIAAATVAQRQMAVVASRNGFKACGRIS